VSQLPPTLCMSLLFDVPKRKRQLARSETRTSPSGQCILATSARSTTAGGNATGTGRCAIAELVGRLTFVAIGARIETPHALHRCRAKTAENQKNAVVSDCRSCSVQRLKIKNLKPYDFPQCNFVLPYGRRSLQTGSPRTRYNFGGPAHPLARVRPGRIPSALAKNAATEETATAPSSSKRSRSRAPVAFAAARLGRRRTRRHMDVRR
jgi:hypothetical protein